MGLGKLLADHKPSVAPSEEKAKKAHQEEILKEAFPERKPPAEEKRGPGRPRKNSADTPRPKSTSKSPSRANTNIDLPQVPPKTGSDANVTAEEAAAYIGNQSIVRQLRKYCRRFPQFAPHPNYNPWLNTPEQNRKVIHEIKMAVKAEVEFLTVPCITRDSLREGEKAAMLWAVTHPESKVSPYIMQMRNASDSLLSDPAVDLDLGLIECEVSDFLPDSPFVRLLINGARVLLKTFNANSDMRQRGAAPPSDTDEKKFAEF